MQFRENEIDGCFTKFDGARGDDFGAVVRFNPNGCVFNANNVVPTASENRVNNFNVKMYVKV